MNNCGIANFVHKRNACRFIISPNQDGMIAFLHDEWQMQKQRRKSTNPLNSIEHMLAPFERESFHCQTFSMSSLTNPCLQGLRLEWGCWSWEGWGGLAHHPHQRQMIVPKIHLDHDESRHRSWKFLSKFATHQTIKLPIDSAINGDHLRPPALAALLALLARMMVMTTRTTDMLSKVGKKPSDPKTRRTRLIRKGTPPAPREEAMENIAESIEFRPVDRLSLAMLMIIE